MKKLIAYEIKDRELFPLVKSYPEQFPNYPPTLGAVASFGNYKLNIVWDLDTEIIPILKWLGEAKCRELYEKNLCEINGHRIYYRATYVFSVDYAHFYGINRYFPGEDKPESLEGLHKKGCELLEALRVMGLEPTKLSSPIAIWEEYVMKHLDLPTALDMPEEAAEMAWYCSGKIWTEAYQIGYWK